MSLSPTDAVMTVLMVALGVLLLRFHHLLDFERISLQPGTLASCVVLFFVATPVVSLTVEQALPDDRWRIPVGLAGGLFPALGLLLRRARSPAQAPSEPSASVAQRGASLLLIAVGTVLPFLGLLFWFLLPSLAERSNWKLFLLFIGLPLVLGTPIAYVGARLRLLQRSPHHHPN